MELVDKGFPSWYCKYSALALILAAAALAGCSALPGGGPLTNHVAVTIDESRCMAASRWGSLSITGDINERECAAIVEGRRARDMLRWMEAQYGVKK